MTSLRFDIGKTAAARIGGHVLALPLCSGLAS
jgi:hypothetical protein